MDSRGGRTSLMSENEVIEDDAAEMIGESIPRTTRARHNSKTRK